MRPGPPAHPRRCLNPAFREAVRNAMVREWPAHRLVEIADYPAVSALSRDLHAPILSLTPLTERRLRTIALAIEFGDEVFLDVVAESELL